MESSTLSFFKGGGEMGHLIRSRDWKNTSLGPIEQWSQSLRTTISIIINSKFPMFLFWGDELNCFYNDAYRPSLGQNGKHPDILGMPAKSAWPEIWDVIKPLVDQVMDSGEATWSENQLIPIYRNGTIEDVYWTFSYSPVNDDRGEIVGILVTCSETTKNITTLQNLTERNEKFLQNIMQAPVGMAVVRGEEFIVEIANSLILEIWKRDFNEIINKPIFDVLPEICGQNLKEVLKLVYQTSEKITQDEYPVLLYRNGTAETAFVNFVYEPLRENDGKIFGVMVIATEVTAQVNARKTVENGEKRFRNTVKQVPLGITILNGPEFVVEMANETYLQFVDKPESDFVGKTLFESLPEVKEIVEPLLNGVMETGVAFNASDLSVELNRYGKKELAYFNLVYHPMTEDNGTISGIIVVASEVTESVKARQFLGESERQFRNMVMQSPIAMTILRGN